MKPELLYHGSIRKLEGAELLPREPDDVEMIPDNHHNYGLIRFLILFSKSPFL